MKIYCDRCGKEITAVTNNLFEQYQVGQAECPECHKKQKRYISESDLLLYFGISETFYLLITFITLLLMNIFGFSYLIIGLLIGLFVISIYIQKLFSELIYVNAYFKEDTKNKILMEDKQLIKKNMSWQFMLFFALVITAVTENEFKSFFIFASVLAVVITYLKFALALKKEREAK